MSLLKCNFTNKPAKLQNVLFIFKRFKSKSLITSTVRALEHFDDFYGSVFGEKWPSVRLALLSKPRYVAVINNYGDTEKTEEFFQNQGAFDLRSFLEVQKKLQNEKSEQKETAELEDEITWQLQEQEEKESNLLHPEGMNFKLKVDSVKEMNVESEDSEHVYKAENARTSLYYDFHQAEIDEMRLIKPGSQIHEGSMKDFIPATQLRGAEAFIPESEYYRYYQTKSISSLSVEEEHEIDFPDKLKVYAFDRGDISDFPDPDRNLINLYNYLKVDGSELLAALALGVQPNDTVLDLNSSSGSIAYCILQTLLPKFLICARDETRDVKDLFSQYLSEYSQLFRNMLYVTSQSAERFVEGYLFDKILVNVPSTDDRNSLFEDEENIFHPLKTRKRIRLPEIQCSLLVQGLNMVKPGGTVLYTSTTLSPVQNDGVVHEALRSLWEDTKQEFVVKDLTPALRHMSLFFNYGDSLNMKFGTLIVPFLPVNFGPRYMCKIVKKGET